jgi:hypothetical protein
MTAAEEGEKEEPAGKKPQKAHKRAEEAGAGRLEVPLHTSHQPPATSHLQMVLLPATVPPLGINSGRIRWGFVT